jgi:hypothetical protein
VLQQRMVKCGSIATRTIERQKSSLARAPTVRLSFGGEVPDVPVAAAGLSTALQIGLKGEPLTYLATTIGRLDSGFIARKYEALPAESDFFSPEIDQ